MKKIILIILTFFFITACEFINSNSEIDIGSMNDYDFENDIVVNSITDAFDYCSNTIQYKLDTKEYWQLPEETYALKTGDCEDFCIFFMYLLKVKLNIDSELVSVENKIDSTDHVLVYIAKTDLYYELIHHFISPNILSEWYAEWYCPYPEAIWMTYYYHNNVGKYSE